MYKKIYYIKISVCGLLWVWFFFYIAMPAKVRKMTPL